MRANPRILAASLIVLCGACCKKTTIENQQGTLAVDDGKTAVDFGSPCPGNPSTQTLSIDNTSLGDVEVTALTVNGSDFVATPPALPFTVPAGGSVPLPIAFTPTSTGPEAATLTITSDAANSPLSVNLTGTGQSGGPDPVYSATCNYLLNGAPFSQPSPCSSLLWSANVGSYVDDSIDISDQGCPPIIIQSAVITGNDGGVFTLPNLPSLPGSVAPGMPLSLDVRYTPVTSGTFDQATLILTTNDPVNSSGGTPGVFIYNLTGTGLAPAIQISPSPYDFGAASQGQAETQIFTVVNNGTLPVTLQAPALTSGAPFALSNAWPSGTVLAAFGAPDGGSDSAQCTVTFTSPGSGLFQDQLSVSYSSAEGSGTVSSNLIAHSASGLCPSPDPVVLNSSGFCGSVSTPLTLGNCGDANLQVTAIDFSSSGNPDNTFSVTLPAGTALPTNIPPDGGLTVTVTYTDNGDLTEPAGTLLVVSDDPSAPDGGTPITVEADVTPVTRPGDSPAQQTGSTVGVGVTTVFVASPGNDAPLYSYVWSVIPSTNITLVTDGGTAWVTPSAAGNYNVCLQEYEQPLDGGATCGIDSGVPGNCTPFKP